MTRNAQHDHIAVPPTTSGLTRRGSRLGRWGAALVGGVVIVHGAVHLLGAAKGLGWADVPALAQPITAVAGAAWLLAAVVTTAAGALFLASVRWWWTVGAAAAVLSQVMIVIGWNDAAVGTVPNVVLAAAVIYAYAAHGPTSFESEYRHRAGNALRSTSMDHGDGPVLTERDLESLPAPVARYVRQSGAVDKPYVGAFRAVIHGRIRSAAGKPWMEFTGEQVNTYGPWPERFFTMDATMAHLPVDVLHVFAGETATMRVKLCSLLPMVNSTGPELTRAETVTLLNDLCVLAPGALAAARIAWSPVDDHRTRATFTRGEHTVTADLVFNKQDQLVDFSSDDRYAGSPDGKTFRQQRWSTPLHNYQTFHGRTISASGLGCWHTPQPKGQFTYLEFEVDDITYHGPDARRLAPASAAEQAA
jgi:hypothetical protein